MRKAVDSNDDQLIIAVEEDDVTASVALPRDANDREIVATFDELRDELFDQLCVRSSAIEAHTGPARADGGGGRD